MWDFLFWFSANKHTSSILSTDALSSSGRRDLAMVNRMVLSAQPEESRVQQIHEEGCVWERRWSTATTAAPNQHVCMCNNLSQRPSPLIIFLFLSCFLCLSFTRLLSASSRLQFHYSILAHTTRTQLPFSFSLCVSLASEKVDTLDVFFLHLLNSHLLRKNISFSEVFLIKYEWQIA